MLGAQEQHWKPFWQGIQEPLCSQAEWPPAVHSPPGALLDTHGQHPWAAFHSSTFLATHPLLSQDLPSSDPVTSGRRFLVLQVKGKASGRFPEELAEEVCPEEVDAGKGLSSNGWTRSKWGAV